MTVTETDKTRKGIVRVASGGTRVAVGGGGLVDETVLCVVGGRCAAGDGDGDGAGVMSAVAVHKTGSETRTEAGRQERRERRRWPADRCGW